VRIFKNKWFSRFAKKEGITTNELKGIVSDLEKVLWDADLGGGVYKKRGTVILRLARMSSMTRE
jgi:hypothetical protein